MKKFALFFMISVLSLVLLLSSCDNAEDASSNDNHVHAYGEWTTVSEATCQKSGTKERVCSCGNKETETIATIPHHYVNNVCTMCKKNASSEFEPDYEAGQENVVGNDYGFSHYTSQANYLYFSANRKNISKIKNDKTGLQTVYQVTAGSVFNVNVVGDWIYFYCRNSSIEKSYIAKVRTDGSDFEKIVSSVHVEEMLVAKNTVYYTTPTTNGKYNDFAKEVLPLYCVSVNGGTPKQLHDGAVSNMVADSTYLYFVHTTESENQNISRVKHGSMKSNVLLSNKEFFKLSLENSKLYFFVFDIYDRIYSLASISTSGGSYTVYGKVVQYSEALHVIGNKAYYMGGLYSENESSSEAGLVEYDLKTKKGRIVKEDYETSEFQFAGDYLFFEKYNSKKLESLTIYYAKKNTFEEVKLS